MTAFNAVAAGPQGLPRGVDIVRALETGELAAAALLEQTYAAIAERNTRVNAICTLAPIDNLLPGAVAVDERRAHGDPLPPLAGIPIAVKDLAATAGMLTTFGSTLMAKHVPETDNLMVSRLRDAGALIIGKTNTPEFGAGSHTFNGIFGATRTPYQTELIAGGSSGGAAAALGSGMLAFADGSDMGGSLRNPAAYCNVVGLRPTMGRVPTWPQAASGFARMGVEGPMARTAEDCAYLLKVMAGADPRDPRSLLPPLPEASLERDLRGLRLGFAPTPAGLPVETGVSSVLSGAPATFADLGSEIDEIGLEELAGAMAVFKTLRAAAYAMLIGDLYKQRGDAMKATLAGNVRAGLELTSEDIYNAEIQRSQQQEALCKLFERYDYLLLPSTQVMPFDVNKEFPTEINGVPMDSYVDWMSTCCIISPFDLPCASVPAGFDSQGIPVGLQIVGRQGDDWGVLQLAYAYQQQTRHWQRAPDWLAPVS